MGGGNKGEPPALAGTREYKQSDRGRQQAEGQSTHSTLILFILLALSLNSSSAVRPGSAAGGGSIHPLHPYFIYFASSLTEQ